ncbi:MAG TPA: ribosome-associated translation inhibitor RaiA, partial [Candidatus Acidoferrum sp.]|nr:ribosome-associated translation inhibitor RaiA [Candidatus Acidoferrum sp.]
SYAEEKLRRLTKYFEHIVTANVVLALEKHRQIAEVTLRVRDLTIRAEESTEDLYSSIDLVVEKLERQILRYKERIGAHVTRGASREERDTAAASLAETESRLVKTKRFAVKPAEVDEAIMQMDLLGHNFYVFRNARTDEVNVVYRRRDGHYGLIEPEG